MLRIDAENHTEDVQHQKHQFFIKNLKILELDEIYLRNLTLKKFAKSTSQFP